MPEQTQQQQPQGRRTPEEVRETLARILADCAKRKAG